MKSPFPVTSWAVDANSASLTDAIFIGQEGLEFEKEIWQVLVEGGWPPKGISRELPYDIVIEADPRIHVVCKAIAGPHGWFDAIGRAFYRMHCEPDSRTILAVPSAGGFVEKISYFCKKNDLYVATPDTLADTVAALTKPPGKDRTPDVGSASETDDVQF